MATLPNPNPIPNSGTVLFDYDVGPAESTSSSLNTNIVNTQIFYADLIETKYVNKSYARVGETVSYTVVINNNGNTTANTVVFKDTIPTGTTFVNNTLFINSNPNSTNPNNGVTIPNIIPNGVTTITFDVVVNTIPNPNPFINQSSTNFFFQVDPLSNPNASAVISNEVQTLVNQASIDTNGGGLVKYVDLGYAKVGDLLTYKIVLKNTGNVTATNVVLTDTIPNNTSFSPGSVFVDNVNNPVANPSPPTGVFIGTIPAGSVSTLTFNVIVSTLPTLNPIPNSSTVSYNFTIIPTVPNGGSSSGNSNTVNTNVFSAFIDNNASSGLVKYVDKAYGKVGDSLLYTIVLKNTGNTTANNIVFTDTIPTGTTFEVNSVRINNVPVSGSNPTPGQGVLVGTLPAGSVSTITFNVTVNTIPTPNPIPNNGTVNFSYVFNPTLPQQSTGGNTNTVSTLINTASFGNNGIIKYVDLSQGKVGDTLTYTIVLNNTGNVTATNVTLIDTIPLGTTYLDNTLFLNSVNQPGAIIAPPSGFLVGTIPALSTATINFSVQVATLPTINPIPNQAVVNYNFLSDPLGVQQSGSNSSNQVFTAVNQAIIDANSGGLTKYVDKSYAKVGEVLLYTIVLKNTGNVTATNIVLTDTIPNNTTFINDTVYVNNLPRNGSNPNPPTGVFVGTLPANTTATVTFNVFVNTLPTVNPINNDSTLNFNFALIPTLPNSGSGSGNSNRVSTIVNQATIDNGNGSGLVKYVDQSFAKVGSILKYTIVMKNTGNVAANNIVLTDTTPNNTTFIINSVFLNSVNQGGVNPNPPTGVTVGTISPGSVATVEFNVQVITLPTVNPIQNNSTVRYNFTVIPTIPNGGSSSGNSNTVNTIVNQASIDNANGQGLVKTVNTNYAKVGDTLSYTLYLKNTGNVTATNVVLTDTIPNNTSFVPDSVYINFVNQPGFNPAPPTGVSIGTIVPGASATVTFNVLVFTLPTVNPITNTGTVNYNFTIDPSQPNAGSSSGNANAVTTTVNTASFDNGSGGLVKYTNKQFSDIGQEILYTLVLKNNGNVAANNVVLTDTIPSGTNFVTDSVYLNGVRQFGVSPAPGSGVSIGSILPGRSATVTFSVSVYTLPSPNPIPNSGTLNYSFTLIPTVPNGQSGSSNSNIVNTQVNSGGFNPVLGGITKQVNTTFAKVGDILTYTIAFNNTGNVTVTNTILTDTIPTYTTFVDNSIYLNGANQPSAVIAPPTGLFIGTVPVAQVNTVSFNVKVVTLPAVNPITNTAVISYNYTTDPSFPNAQASANASAPVFTDVFSAIIDAGAGLTKSVDKAYADLNETVTYTIAVRNTGNVTATNVILTDTIPTGTSFIIDSVTVDSIPQPGVNPNPPIGISLGSINAGVTKFVSFKVTVSTIPTPNPFINNSTINYNFTMDPQNVNGSSGSGNSNSTSTQVNSANFNSSLVKAVDKTIATVKNVLRYTLSFTNGGNVAANNVTLTDTIPLGTSFIPNSVVVNGVTVPGANPTPGIGVSLGSVLPNSTNTITFSVLVTTVPSPNPIVNSGVLRYSYTVNPNNVNGVNGNNMSNNVQTLINYARIATFDGGFVKTQDKAIELVGESITYSIKIVNTGSVTANSVVLYDTIPTATSYIAGSTAINGSFIDRNPNLGVTLADIAPGSSLTVSFSVTVTTVPSPNLIQNSSDIAYSWVVDPQVGSTDSARETSNTTNNTVAVVALDSTKSTSISYADIGDTLTYRVILRNNGNVTAENILIKDTLPNATSYINNTFYLNSILRPGANPVLGYNIGNLAPTGVATIDFNVSIVTLPTINPMINTFGATFTFIVDPSSPSRNGSTVAYSNSTTVNNAGFNPFLGGFTKSVDKAYATIGDTLNYTLVAKNTGNVTAQNVVLSDTIPTGTTFQSGSVIVDGTPQSGNIASGISLGLVTPGQATTITFKVTVVSANSDYKIDNNGVLKYGYLIDPNGSLKSGSNLSNTVTTLQRISNISINKTSNKSTLIVGNTLTYNLVITNTGNTTANNVFVADTIPASLQYVSGSTIISGTAQPTANIVSGVTLPSIAPNASTTISFIALAVSVPPGGTARNVARANYTFSVDPSLPGTSSYVESNSDVVVISYYFNNTKVIPCSAYCVTTVNNTPIGLFSKLNAASKATNTSCTNNCDNPKSYTVLGLCSSTELSCINTSLQTYKMWQEQSLDTTKVFENGISEIDTVCASISILRSSLITIPSTGTCTNYEGKLLSGYKQIIEGLIKYTVTFIDNSGVLCTENFYDIFSSFILVNSNYLDCELDVKGCVEDINIIRFCGNEVSFGTTFVLYLVPKGSGCDDNCSCNFESEVTNCISNSNLCGNLANFISPCESFWNEFNIFTKDDTGLNDIGELTSVNAIVGTPTYQIVSTPKSIYESAEGLNSTGTMLLVAFVINIKLNYISDDGTSSLKRVNLAVPASTYIVVNDQDICSAKFKISTCVEDIYVCNLDGNTVFTNTTLLVKANLCSTTTCCK